MTFDMASASSVQVVSVIEPLIQHAGSLFPEGIASLHAFYLQLSDRQCALPPLTSPSFSPFLEVDFKVPELPGNSDLTSSQSLPCVADPHSCTDPSITPVADRY